jgi:hypothetical protein
LQATGPLTGKHFYVKVEVLDQDSRLVGEKKEPAAHNDYVPSMWRRNDLILHATSFRVKKSPGTKPTVCVQFFIDKRALKTDAKHNKACFKVPME